MAATFVVQTDEGVDGANAYASVAYYRQFFDDRGVDTSSLTDNEIQIYIVNGTEYLDYRWKHQGSKLNGRDQKLQYPRTGICDSEGNTVTGVPTEVKDATCQYSKAYGDLNSLFITDNEGKGGVTEEYSKLGPLEERYKYANPTKKSSQKFPVIQAGDLIMSQSGFVSSTSFHGRRA